MKKEQKILQSDEKIVKTPLAATPKAVQESASHAEMAAQAPCEAGSGEHSETKGASENASDGLKEVPVKRDADGAPVLTAEMRILLARAERQGYMRGRNERIEELMAVPPEFSDADAVTEQEVEILRSIRRSIWEE